MFASQYGQLEVVRTLLEGKALVNDQSNVRNQKMMMMMIIIILLTILMMMIIIIIILYIYHFYDFYFIFISHLFIIIIGWIHTSHIGQ
jgi:hypothetical protein